MRQNEHGIVLRQRFADIVFIKMPAADNGNGHFALGIHDVNIGDLDPAVQLHGLSVRLGGISLSVICSVAFYYRSADAVNGRLHKIGAQEVLVARLAAVQLHGNVALKLNAQRFICSHNVFRTYFLYEIHF